MSSPSPVYYCPGGTESHHLCRVWVEQAQRDSEPHTLALIVVLLFAGTLLTAIYCILYWCADGHYLLATPSGEDTMEVVTTLA